MINSMINQIQTITQPKIIFKSGKPTEVILKWRDFQEILEKIEDIHDLSQIRKIKSKKINLKNFEDTVKKYGI